MSYYQQNQAPRVAPPWISQWDDQSQRYFYINQETGERTWDLPSGYGGGSGSGGNYGYGAAGVAGYKAQRVGEQSFPID